MIASKPRHSCVSVLILLAGCSVSSGPAQSDHGSNSKSGDVVLNIHVSPSLSANFGTDAVEAAGKAAGAYLGRFPGPLTEEHKSQAVTEGMKQGTATAAANKKKPSQSATKELEQSLTEAVDEEAHSRRY